MTVESNFILPHIPDDKLASVRAAVKVCAMLQKTKKRNKTRKLICCASLSTLPHYYY